MLADPYPLRTTGHAIPGSELLLTTWQTPILGFQKQERQLRTGSTGGCLRSIVQRTRSGACSYWIGQLTSFGGRWKCETGKCGTGSIGTMLQRVENARLEFENGKGMERHVWHNLVAHMNTEKCRPSLSHSYHHGAASVLDQILIRLSCHVQSQLLWRTYLQRCLHKYNIFAGFFSSIVDVSVNFYATLHF